MSQRTLSALLAVSTLACGGAKAHQAIWEPSGSDLAIHAPDSFRVTFETSAGEFVVAFYRDLAPLGVDRIYHLTRYNFYAGARFFRVNPGLVQFGLSGQPALDSV
ncbi:MAG: peptidylprolyl isomerase, partial [Gemmatimonadota bacterium]|nr:peptidylprolyl isomerase [Gemmatimonadota bacterium]